MREETWKPIVGYEEEYMVSDMGRVKSLKYKGGNKEKVLKSCKTSRGYVNVVLVKDGKHKSHSVHRLVAQTFIPNPHNKPYVDHINTIRHDNRVENLRWVTHTENCNNPKTKNKYSEYAKSRSKEHQEKLNNSKKGKPMNENTKKSIIEKNSKKVYCFELDKYFNSMIDVQNELEINAKYVSLSCRRKMKHPKIHFFYSEQVLYK